MKKSKHETLQSDRINEINSILENEYLSVKQISALTGLSRDRAQKMRSNIIKVYGKEYHYTSKSAVKIEHFLEYYNSRKLHSMYEKLFNIKSCYQYSSIS